MGKNLKEFSQPDLHLLCDFKLKSAIFNIKKEVTTCFAINLAFIVNFQTFKLYFIFCLALHDFRTISIEE